ncbi:VAV protein, partial [Nothoprocta ornata]|nr:VAV protein [Nothoprocta ornata]
NGSKGVKMPQISPLGAVGCCLLQEVHQPLAFLQNKLQRLGPEKKKSDLGLPKMEASQPYSGIPPPPGNMGPPLRLSPGDIVEVMKAEAEQLWWQVG